jgi:hypothetical protein
MVYAASEVGTMERKDIKQWSLVLVLLSVTTLFIGSVGGYLVGKYLHVLHGQSEFPGMTNQNASTEGTLQPWQNRYQHDETEYFKRRYL